MTQSEKAAETRRKRNEARKARERERREIREKMRKTCVRVIDDPLASSADKIMAVEILQGQLLKGR